MNEIDYNIRYTYNLKIMIIQSEFLGITILIPN